MSETPAENGISRRKFVIGTAAGVVAAAAVGTVGTYLLKPTPSAVTTTETTTKTQTNTETQTKTATSTTTAQNLPSKWDYQTDVVVVGSGGAGLAAALGALESGAKVIILEKASAVGGTTAMSGGGMWIPNNSLAVAQGLTDTTANLTAYLDAVGGGQQDDALITTYLSQAPVWLDHLDQVTNGSLKLYLSPQYNDYYNVGVTRSFGHLVETTLYGAGLVKALQNVVDGKGATTMLSTPATGLYVDNTGRIVGVEATSNSNTINISAAKGVILAAGGYDHNVEMMANYPRGPILGSSAAIGNTGDGILMAMAAGAEIGNMNNNWGVPTYVTSNGIIQDWAQWRTKPGAIIVNSAGKRFVNESSAYPVANRAFLSWDTKIYGYPNIPAYTIMDSTAFTKYGLAGASSVMSTLPSYVYKADKLTDLAALLNIDPTNLQDTITAFNANAVNGVDPDFNRGVFSFDTITGGDPTRSDLKNDCLAPLETPPYYGAQISPGTCGTCGGPKINTNGQILDKNGNPIPGLYGAGNDIAAPWGAAYPGGGSTVGAGTTFGWIAGKSAGSS